MGTLSRDRGYIFDIQRYAIHDGPGIRTTVFFKGCPLRCAWCHNPEGIDGKSELMYRQSRCVVCGRCIEVCSEGAIELSEGRVLTNRQKCRACGACVKVCPAEARELAGGEMTTDEVMAEIIRDVIFFDQSGGGATFCGGEPLAQAEFLGELLCRCRSAGIHTAVDTSCYADRNVVEGLAEKADLFLCDIKHMDADKHRQFTGADNGLILSNIEYLAGRGRPITVRVPVVPGFNDDEEAIGRIGEFVKGLKKVHQIDLLPYNSGGKGKTERLGKTYIMGTPDEMDKGQTERLAEILRRMGFFVRIGG